MWKNSKAHYCKLYSIDMGTDPPLFLKLQLLRFEHKTGKVIQYRGGKP